MKRALLALLTLGLIAGCASTVHPSKASAPASSTAPLSVPSVTAEIAIPEASVVVDPPPAGLAQSADQLALYAKVATAGEAGAQAAGFACASATPTSVKLAAVTDTIDRGASKMTSTPAYVLTWNTTLCVDLGGPAPEPGESRRPAPPPRADCTFITIVNATTGKYVEAFQY